MLGSATSKITSFKKKLKNSVLSCEPLKKILQLLSPLTPVLYSILLITLIKTHPQNDNVQTAFYCLMGSFMVISLLNAFYEMFNEKQKYSTIRQLFLNIFYGISLIILGYFIFSSYLIPICTNFSSFADGLKNFLFTDKTFFQKIGAFMKLFSVIGACGTIIYKSVMKYIDTPEENKLNIYIKQGETGLRRSNDEYTRINLWLSVVPPLVSMIVNFFTVNDKTTLIFGIASILQAFHVSHNKKSQTQFLPLLISVMCSVLVCLKFFVYCRTSTNTV